jgi:hypothetical protein
MEDLLRFSDWIGQEVLAVSIDVAESATQPEIVRAET